MWANDRKPLGRGFSTPQPTWNSRPRDSLVMPMSERKSSSPVHKGDLFHVVHKVPAGDSPYVRAKHVQLIEKDPSRAISLFWAAINAGDRIDSALKDMAVVMKQLNRSDEAIEAIKSFRHLCPYDAQESLDNVLVELYKRSGRIEEEVELLQHKLKNIEGVTFGGKRTKTARSQGKKIQITVEQEKSRILGNLAWAYLQQHNYGSAEQYYRKALSLEVDKNKQCNLAICLMHMNRIAEAKSLLLAVRDSPKKRQMDESCAKSFERAYQILREKESQHERSGRSEDSFYVVDNESSNSDKNGLDNWSNGCCSESSLEMSNFADGMKRYQNGKETEASLGNNSYSTCTRRKSGIFLTQPRRCSWGLEDENYREIWGKSLGGSSVRKLSFEQNKITENAFSHASGNLKSGILLTQPRRCSWGLKDEKYRERLGKSLGGSSVRKLSFEQAKITENAFSHASGNLIEEPVTCTDDNVESHSGVLLTQPRVSLGINEDQRGKWGENMVDSSPRQLSFEYKNQKEDPVDENPENLKDKAKKSWADIAEEDEEMYKELVCGDTPSKYFDGLKSKEEEEKFSDENLDTNLMYQSPYYPLSQTEAAGQELKSFYQKDGYNGTSGNAVSSRNPTARRSLYFGGDSNSLPLKEKDSFTGKNISMTRRNRLKVFTEITLLPDSP
ncbi:protein POLLENLESS 3-like [Carica papaya]|uniref:protein POLLENLESS 3-like n=1 Tax=Carica papaya TaxID=3649 RepID=UPI000B8D0A6B|nr:protein POLLENLESS 3-like [Carica papaya]